MITTILTVLRVSVSVMGLIDASVVAQSGPGWMNIAIYIGIGPFPNYTLYTLSSNLLSVAVGRPNADPCLAPELTRVNGDGSGDTEAPNPLGGFDFDLGTPSASVLANWTGEFNQSWNANITNARLFGLNGSGVPTTPQLCLGTLN